MDYLYIIGFTLIYHLSLYMCIILIFYVLCI